MRRRFLGSGGEVHDDRVSNSMTSLINFSSTTAVLLVCRGALWHNRAIAGSRTYLQNIAFKILPHV